MSQIKIFLRKDMILTNGGGVNYVNLIVINHVGLR